MFKTLGILMIVFSVFMISYFKADEVKRRFENLKQLKRGLTIIKNEISFSSREMESMSRELSEILDGDCAKVFSFVSHSLRENPGMSFGQAWSESVKEIGKGKFISESSEKIMSDFAYLTGQVSKELEIENIEKAEKLLEEEIKTESESFEKNRKLIFSLGGITGLSLLIILL